MRGPSPRRQATRTVVRSAVAVTAALTLAATSTATAFAHVGAPIAAAQRDAAPTVEVVLSHITPVLGPGSRPVQTATPEAGATTPATTAPAELSDLQIRLVLRAGSVDLTDASVLVEVLRPATSAADLAELLDGPVDDVILRSVQRHRVADLDAHAVRAVRIDLDAALLGFRSPVGDTGVYPVRLRVQAAGSDLTEVRTAFVFLEDEPTDPAPAVVFWPVTGAPARGAQDRHVAGGADSWAVGGPLARKVRAAAANPGVATPLIAAHVVEELFDRADGHVEMTAAGPVEYAADGPLAQQASDDLARLSAWLTASLMAIPRLPGWSGSAASRLRP